MNFSPKAVALDIDGTLLTEDGEMTAALILAVQAVSEQVPVILATGRQVLSTYPVAQRLALPDGFLVCANGATTFSYPDLELIDEHTFDPTEAIESVRRMRPDVLMAVEGKDGEHLVTARFPEGDLGGEQVVVSDEDLASRPVTRLVVRDPHGSDADFVGLAESLGLKEVGYFVGWTAWLDIAPLGVNKTTGLDVALGRLGIDPAGLLAFGDGRNDIEMLQYAGLGVAMGPAPEEVKDAADEVTGSVYEDGVVQVLTRLFDLEPEPEPDTHWPLREELFELD